MHYRQQVACEKCGTTRPETRPLIVFPAGTISRLMWPALAVLVMVSATAGGALLSHAWAIGCGFEHGASVGGGIALLALATVLVGGALGKVMPP